MLIPEDICNRLHGFFTLIIWEETPPPLPVGCLTDVLSDLTIQHRVIVFPCNGLLLLLSVAGGSVFPGGPFRLGITYQAQMDIPLLEVHPPGDPHPDLPGPADAQRLCEDDVGEYKGFIGVPTLFNYPFLFHVQYDREAAHNCYCGCGVPDIRLSG